ncbi:DUF6787 family protein [Dyadobacter tibetensis]|uniref:DUF6787 family protein n=1 Tax=Dyadobacter tibetensis TaxID=1211851 RepID=UPI0004725166|nr:DUF6787 family protein [Dyadobacter tibetensis]
MIEKLKERWEVKNGWDVLVILLVFACTGFSVLYVKRALFDLLGFHEATPTWLRWLVNIVIILPLYQVILLAWGWIWGKYAFFLAFEKRMFGRIAGWFRRK